jgi:hypothetical protein
MRWTRKKRCPLPSLLSAAAMLAACFDPAIALAQTQQTPYQVTQAVGDSSTCAPQCVLNFPTVPVGQRLVVTNVSAQTGLDQTGFVIEGNGATAFVPKPYPTAGTLALPVLVYFEPSSNPTARFFVPNATQHTSLIVTFAGYLVPVP